MATAGDGKAPYESTGAGGKFRKRPFRRSVPATPYDRPPTPIGNGNNHGGLLTKLVDPASRLIYAGAHRLFGAFRKRLPPLLLAGPPELNEEAQIQNVAQEAVQNNRTGVSQLSTDQGVNSAAAGISELEQMLKQKTFTRSEIQRLTALLHSKTTESPSDDVVERDAAKPPSSSSPLLRLEASTSGSLKKYGNERDNFHADISTPVVSSRVLEEEIASPAELAKAYMGSRPMKVSPSALGISNQTPRQDMNLLNNASGLPKTPIASMAPKTSNSFRGLENGFLTPRSRGRSAMYSMARTPYSRAPSTLSKKEISPGYGHAAALTSSPSTWGQEGKMALKRRSSVLEDDIGSGGPLRRTRQKANLMPHGSSLLRDKRELGYTALQQPDASSQKLLLMNKPKDVEENGDTSMRGGSGYGSVPTKSTQTATKILQQLERLSPKEKKSESKFTGITRDKSPGKLTLNMLHGQALRSVEKVDSPKFLPSPRDDQKSDDGQHDSRLRDVREPAASRGKEKVEENGSKKFPIPRNMLAPVNGDLTVSSKDKAPIVMATASTSKLPAEPPQKKRAFQMSAHEDWLELDDDIHVNGHVSFSSAENKKPEPSLVANKPVSAEVIQTPTLPEIPKTFTEATPVLPEVDKIPEQAELKEAEKVASPPKTDVGFLGGSVSEQGTGFKFPTSPPSTTTTQTGGLNQSAFQMEKAVPEKDSNIFSSFSASAEKVSPFQFSTDKSSEIKPKADSDPKALDSTSFFSSVSKSDYVKFPAFNKDENGDDKKAANTFGKSESLPSPALAATSTSGSFSFGIGKNSSTPDETPASTPPMFSSSFQFPASGATLNSFFNNTSSNLTSASTATVISTTTTTTADAATVFSTSVPAAALALSTSLPAPVFSFGSAVSPNPASAAPTSVAEKETGNANATDEKEPKSNMSSSPFATTSFAATTTGSSVFGFSSPATTSITINNQSTTINNQTNASFFNVTSGSQATNQTSTAVTQAVPFQFGSSAPSIALGSTAAAPSSTSGGLFFGSSAPAFSSTPSFGIGSVAASSEAKSSSFASGPTTTASVFGSAAAWQPPKSSGFGSTFSSQPPAFAFGASSTPVPSASSSPIMFGSSTTGTASTGPSMFSFGATGAANSAFAAPSQGQSVFGNAVPIFGAGATSPNNNDQMSMEDSMAEDSMLSPTPISQFGQAPAAAAPGFMFGSTTPTPTPTPAALPFQFGGQPNQAPAQNPFQSSSVEFNAGGGSFSLGSGGDKSGRRIVRVKNKNRRK